MRVEELLEAKANAEILRVLTFPGHSGVIIGFSPKDSSGYRNTHPWEVKLQAGKVVQCRANDLKPSYQQKRRTRRALANI